MFNDKPHNSEILRVVLAVWPEAEHLSVIELSRLYGAVREVIDGLPTPTLSRLEREAVKVAWNDAGPRGGTCL